MVSVNVEYLYRKGVLYFSFFFFDFSVCSSNITIVKRERKKSDIEYIAYIRKRSFMKAYFYKDDKRKKDLRGG